MFQTIHKEKANAMNMDKRPYNNFDRLVVSDHAPPLPWTPLKFIDTIDDSSSFDVDYVTAGRLEMSNISIPARGAKHM